MQALQIRPHSPRITGFVLAGLAVLAAGAFSLGLEHQMHGAQATPFPQGDTGGLRARVADTIPEATPAREVALATGDPRGRHRAAPAETPVESAAAAGPAAIDAAAIVHDPAPDTADPPT